MIAIHDEARCFFCGLRINDPAKLNAFMPLLVDAMRVQLLISYDTDRKPTDSRVAAHEGFAIFRFVLVKLAGVRDARDHFLNIVWSRW